MSRFEQSVNVFEGNIYHQTVPRFRVRDPRCFLYGFDREKNPVEIGLNDNLLSKHMLFLGGIGSGKSTALYQVVEQIQNSMTQNDVMVIFDTKGDFRKRFQRPGDVVISNDRFATGPNGIDYWNIFNEIDFDDLLEENLYEIAKTLFHEKVTTSNSPFFPNAAKDLFFAVLYYFCATPDADNGMDNESLRWFFNNATVSELKNIFTADEYREKLFSFSSYVSKDDSEETQGVFSELQQTIREIFIGNFAKTGTLSIRKLVRSKAARTVFIEYDLGIGNTLTPIYRLLFDLAIKEALSRQDEIDDDNPPNVFLVADEFSLLPQLQHIDNAVNFGRSLGIKLMIGVQNVNQLYHYKAYGHERGESILSGFSTKIAFRLNDGASRSFIQSIFGKNRKILTYLPTVQHQGLVENVYDGNVIEDWDMSNLKIGESIIGLPGQEPFFFYFDKNLP